MNPVRFGRVNGAMDLEANDAGPAGPAGEWTKFWVGTVWSEGLYQRRIGTGFLSSWSMVDSAYEFPFCYWIWFDLFRIVCFES